MEFLFRPTNYNLQPFVFQELGRFPETTPAVEFLFTEVDINRIAALDNFLENFCKCTLKRLQMDVLLRIQQKLSDPLFFDTQMDGASEKKQFRFDECFQK